MSEISKEHSSNACLKVMLIVFDLIVLLCESLLVGIIIFIATTEKNTLIDGFGQKTFEISFGAVISVGFIVIFVTFLGCVGALKENSGLLKIFSVLMLFFLICEVGALAYTATEIEMTSKYTQTALYDSVKLYNTSEVVTLAWDIYQVRNKCCGVRSRTETDKAPFQAYASANLSVPVSCCLPDLNAMMLNKCKEGSEYFIHKNDCYDTLKEQLSKNFSIIVGIGALTIAITAASLIMSVVMVTSMPGKGREYEGHSRS